MNKKLHESAEAGSPVPAEAPAPQTTLPTISEGVFALKTSLPSKTSLEKSRIVALLDDDALPGGDMIGQHIYVGDYLIHPIEVTDQETGEVRLARRTLLPQPVGEPIAFVSDGVIQSLQRIAWTQGKPPPYDPPVKVRVEQKNTRGGRRLYQLVPVTE